MSWLDSSIDWCKNFEEELSKDLEQSPFWKQALDNFSQYNWQEGFHLDEFLIDFAKQSETIKQLNPHSSFGDLPLTLYLSDRHNFALDLYIWTKSQTAIHDHGFEGCFQVLQGESVECQYTFDKNSKDNPSLGVLKPVKSILLKPGISAPIKPSSGTIHRVLHLSNPTISLCLRTNAGHSDYIQKTYSYNQLCSPSFPPEHVITKQRLLKYYLSNSKIPDKSLLDDIKDYYQTWEIFNNDQKNRAYLLKMEIFYKCHGFVNNMNTYNNFSQIFNKLQTNEAKIILNAYEFFGASDCYTWIEENLNISKNEAFSILKNELVLLETQSEQSELYKGSFLSEFFN